MHMSQVCKSLSLQHIQQSKHLQPLIAHSMAAALMILHVQEFREHGRSREAIEMAFDEVLKQKMKSRHRYGFQPPKSGRRTDVQGDPVVSIPSLHEHDASHIPAQVLCVLHCI